MCALLGCFVGRASQSVVPDTVPTDASWQHHVAYVGIPRIASAVVAKEVQTVHPSARIRSGKGFKTEIDNYIRFSPYPVMAALNLAGYHGRSDWARLGVQTLAANAVMAVAVEATKQAVHQTRPDATDRRSFPSGHTATAFVAATMLHKEYGETRSPWFSVGGYAVASATALMRVLHHRHSAADVMAGAGIGILSTELGYFLTELCMKHKGERQFDAHIASGANMVDITLGVATAPSHIDFAPTDGTPHRLRLGTATTIGIEGVHYFNRLLGVGVQARIITTPTDGLNFSAEQMQDVNAINQNLTAYTDAQQRRLPGIYAYDITDNQLLATTLSAGVYGNLPLTARLSLGAKALLGVRFSDGITYTARNGIPKVEHTPSGIAYWMEDAEGKPWLTADARPGIDSPYNAVLDDATEPFQLLRVKGSTAMNYVLGVSMAWRYRTNMAWKVFADFNAASTRYTYQCRLFSDEAIARIATSGFPQARPQLMRLLAATTSAATTKRMSHLCIGASFSISF